MPAAHAIGTMIGTLIFLTRAEEAGYLVSSHLPN